MAMTEEERIKQLEGQIFGLETILNIVFLRLRPADRTLMELASQISTFSTGTQGDKAEAARLAGFLEAKKTVGELIDSLLEGSGRTIQ